MDNVIIRFYAKIFSVTNLENNCQSVHLHIINLSPLNPEILVKKSPLVVEKLRFVQWDILF